MPERALWQEVLLCAINDARLAEMADPVPQSAADTVAAAREYLCKPSPDLEAVCSMAGVDMDALIDRLTPRLATAPPLPRPPSPQTRRAPSSDGREKAAQERSRKLEHDGQSLSVKDWSPIVGIAVSVIHSRLRSGWSVADALTVPASASHQRRASMRANRLTYQGETLTYREWAERTGINWFIIRERVRKGWAVDSILTMSERGAMVLK